MSSGFISEAELRERRRLRQQQWDEVRQPHQPQEAPEEEYDHRSLYDRLQAQKQKRDLEYEEAHRLKNMIKGLDDDEVEFLDLVDRAKVEEERRKCVEEAKEMAEFRREVAVLQQDSAAHSVHHQLQRKPRPPSPSPSPRSSQSRLLAGAVVNKRRAAPQPAHLTSPAKRLAPSSPHHLSEDKVEEGDGRTAVTQAVMEAVTQEEVTQAVMEAVTQEEVTPPAVQEEGDGWTAVTQAVMEEVTPPAVQEAATSVTTRRGSLLRCVGVLPGLGHYAPDSSDQLDSDDSSDAEDTVVLATSVAAPTVPRFDLVGRKIVTKTTTTSQSSSH